MSESLFTVDVQSRRIAGKVQALGTWLPNALDLFEAVIDWLLEQQRPGSLPGGGGRPIHPKRRDEPAGAAPDLREFAGPWFSAETAARYMDFGGLAPVKAFRQWARRQGLATAHRGRSVLFAKADLLVAIGVARGKRTPGAKPDAK
jgi:hypothetical protein